MVGTASQGQSSLWALSNLTQSRGLWVTPACSAVLGMWVLLEVTVLGQGGLQATPDQPKEGRPWGHTKPPGQANIPLVERHSGPPGMMWIRILPGDTGMPKMTDHQWSYSTSSCHESSAHGVPWKGSHSPGEGLENVDWMSGLSAISPQCHSTPVRDEGNHNQEVSQAPGQVQMGPVPFRSVRQSLEPYVI